MRCLENRINIDHFCYLIRILCNTCLDLNNVLRFDYEKYILCKYAVLKKIYLRNQTGVEKCVTNKKIRVLKYYLNDKIIRTHSKKTYTKYTRIGDGKYNTNKIRAQHIQYRFYTGIVLLFMYTAMDE